MFIGQAEDEDSGKYGKLQYKLKGDALATEYFSMDPANGLIKSKKTFEDISEEHLPFRLTVEARDNPNSATDFNMIEAPLIVSLLQYVFVLIHLIKCVLLNNNVCSQINLISEHNRMILVIGDAKPDMVSGKENALVSAMQDHSGLLVGVERLAARQFLGENGTLESDSSGTDVWFYVVDPMTEKILETNHTRVQR